MAYKFVTIRINDEAAEAELNSFLSRHKIITVDRRWVEQGSESFWSLCVDYQISSSSVATKGSASGTHGRGRIDYKELLSPSDFAVFCKLKELRQEIGFQEAIPIYTIFNNEQIYQMIRQKVATKAELGKIEGVGDARVEKYGERFLTLMRDSHGGKNEATGGSMGNNHQPR